MAIGKAKEISADKPRKVRRTQEQRSQETKEKLLKAATSLLTTNGYARLTTEEVSARAGVTNGARSHHYSSKSDLIVATFEYLYRPAIERGSAMAKEAFTAPDPIEGFLKYCLSTYFVPQFIAFNEIMIGARSDPELRAKLEPCLQEFRVSVLDAWDAAFRARGYSEEWTTAVTTLTLNLFRGMGSNAWWENAEGRNKKALALWQRLIASESPKHRVDQPSAAE